VGLGGLEPPTSSLSGKPKASAISLDPIPELAFLSASVRCCMSAATAVVTQLGTQLRARRPLRPELRAVLGVSVSLLLDRLMVVATDGGSGGPLLYFSAVLPVVSDPLAASVSGCRRSAQATVLSA
jgi:hypothetical protein